MSPLSPIVRPSRTRASEPQTPSLAPSDLPPFSWTRLACHLPLGLLGREIAQSRVHPLPIVVSLHVSEEIAPRLVARSPAALMNELDLEGVEEALHRGVVIAVASPAH